MFAPNLRHLIPSTFTDDEADKIESHLDRLYEAVVSNLLILIRSTLRNGGETHTVEVVGAEELSKPLKDFSSDNLQEALVLAEGYREKEATRQVQNKVQEIVRTMRDEGYHV